MDRLRLTNALLTVALVAAGVVAAVLLYGFATRAFTPRTAPVRTAAADSVLTGATAAALSRITVEVGNGAGVDGLALRTTAVLRHRGFDVVTFGTAPAADSSTVVVRAGTPTDAARVAAALGLPPTRVVPDGPVDDYSPDVSVTLGRDHADFAPPGGP